MLIMNLQIQELLYIVRNINKKSLCIVKLKNIKIKENIMKV